MNRNMRRGLIILLTLLLLGSGGITTWWFTQPAEKAATVPVYTCTQQAQVDYRVFFTPNNFFPEPMAGPGQAYITPLTQYIETVFNYSFSGDSPVEISGQYQVDAVLTGYVIKEKNDSEGTGKEKIKVWAKSYPLLAPTPFAAHDRKLEVKQTIPVDIQSYALFAQQVAQELKFAADLVELMVTYSAQGGASTSEGQIDEPVKAVMVIPIEGTSFMVQGMLADKKETSITQDIKEPVAGVKTTRAGLAAATGLLALLLLLIMFRTRGVLQDQGEKELRGIIKKHGDRIVAGIFEFPAMLGKNPIILHTFDDLLKVADEVSQPILYENVQEGEHVFYLINEPLIYQYTLETNSKESILENRLLMETDNIKM